MKVARLLVELGLNISASGEVMCGPVEIPQAEIAKAAGVDRRVVRDTVKTLSGDGELSPIFSNLKPAGPHLGTVAKYLGYGVVEIWADPHRSGTLAAVASIISKEKVSIRQAIAEDPDLIPDPKLVIVTEKEVSGDALKAILKVPGVSRISAY
ncbi:MAG: amino acid-binding protein [Candidatus Brockarchaeota archaeon]|nr:amino acid-binding protein [Candidatus Brockarchaeota archaeon]